MFGKFFSDLPICISLTFEKYEVLIFISFAWFVIFCFFFVSLWQFPFQRMKNNNCRDMPTSITHTHIHTYKHTHTHTLTHMQTHIHMRTHTLTHIDTITHTHTHTHTSTCVHIYSYTFIVVDMHIFSALHWDRGCGNVIFFITFFLFSLVFNFLPKVLFVFLFFSFLPIWTISFDTHSKNSR